MKKNKKFILIILVTILLLFLLVLSFIIKLYLKKYYKTYTATIVNMVDDRIIIHIPASKRYTISKDTVIYDKNKNVISLSNVNVSDIVYLYSPDNDTDILEKAIIEEITDNNVSILLLYTYFYYYSINPNKDNTFIIDSNNKKISTSTLKVGDTIYIVEEIPEVRIYTSLGKIKVLKVLDKTLDEMYQENTIK